jgi:AraC family transcriptional regulator
MEARIERSNDKKLVGKRMTISLSEYRIGKLWKNFMPYRKNITNRLTDDVISVSVYDPAYFIHFDPAKEFEKWAAIEVRDFDHIPEEMEAFVLPGGSYAVFDYKGSSTDHSIFQYIFETWLPHSDYIPDNRPHFEILGEKYKNNDPDSEEEIWIPIKRKQEVPNN